VPAIEFPYTLHKGYLMPIIPITIQNHKVWVYVDSGATFSMVNAAEARDMGIDWQSGRQQMVVVGDGSFIPVFIHDVRVEIGSTPITVPIGFSERLGVGFNLLGRTGVFNRFEVCFNDHTRTVTFQRITSAAV
jgi:gag-polyprotein putative aspartyl protease